MPGGKAKRERLAAFDARVQAALAEYFGPGAELIRRKNRWQAVHLASQKIGAVMPEWKATARQAIGDAIARNLVIRRVDGKYVVTVPRSAYELLRNRELRAKLKAMRKVHEGQMAALGIAVS